MELKPLNVYGDSQWLDFNWDVFLHNAYDFPDALTIHPWIKNLPRKVQYEYLLRTKHFSKDSVKSNPCSEYQPKSCRNVLLQRLIQKKYKCQINTFYTGKHTDYLIDGATSHTKYQVILSSK